MNKYIHIYIKQAKVVKMYFFYSGLVGNSDDKYRGTQKSVTQQRMQKLLYYHKLPH